MVKQYTEKNIGEVAAYIAKRLLPGNIYTFEGGLAAGKTTLIRHIMHELGYQKTVNSPTFVIEHRYQLASFPIKQVLHLDLYRLNEKDLDNFDWDEYTSPDAVTFIEWPALAYPHLPNVIKEFKIKVINDKTREINIPDNFSN